MNSADQKQLKLEAFTHWCAKHIAGDEKGEAQVFLDRLFQAFGWDGLKEAGARCEERIKKTDGGTSFADLVWKPVVVIEMKKRGSDLSKHYAQAFAYWTRLVPNRPRYAVLCNFDEFWVFDFETQLDTPVDVVRLDQLANRYGPLNFLFPGDVTPIFGNHQEAVTRAAADKLAACFNSLVDRGVERELAQRFVLQLLMALFAEDIGLMEKYFVSQLLDQCKSPQDSYDLIGGLFEAMNTKGGVQGGRFKGIQYFNGGLFLSPARVELVATERTLLKEAAQFDWSRVRPEIFGTLFEHSLGKAARHASGAHFTSPVDIMKIIGPTIVEPWTALIDREDTLSGLKRLLVRIEQFRVLDPACGSGNFLYVAYRELKRLEARIYSRMAELFPKSVDPSQRPFGFVSTTNFFGLDANPFAVDIAKVTMMLAHKLAIDELHTNEDALPLDNLDSSIVCADALVNASGGKPAWPPVDVVIGNPPFLDARRMTRELGRDYVAKLASEYPEISRKADLCTYWFRRTHDHLNACVLDDMVAGRAGLVGTQNIRNNESREGGLDYVVSTGTILDAVDNQPWSGEANVHVSIVNWAKTHDTRIVPEKKRLWFKAGDTLDLREVGAINSALSDAVDVSGAEVLGCNRSPKKCFEGLQPGHDGFRLAPSELASLPSGDLGSIVFPYLGGTGMLTSHHKQVAEYIIDFQDMDMLNASKHTSAFKLLQDRVLPLWGENARRELAETGKTSGEHQNRLQTWWRLKRRRGELIRSVQPLGRYVVCSRHTRLPIFVFIHRAFRPDSSLACFAFDDDYSFGILQGFPHCAWFIAKGSKLTERLRYTPDSVFDTYPWPQAPSAASVLRVAEAARRLREVRMAGMDGHSGGLRTLYRTMPLPGKNPLKEAHIALDEAVLSAYGFSRKDVLGQLLGLNHEMAERLRRNEPVMAPGIPEGFKELAKLLSNDCFGSDLFAVASASDAA